MVKDIFEQYTAAFKSVGAYVLLDSNHNKVATVAFEYPKDGAGVLYCYLHIVGSNMVRGSAKGYGYDRASAAFYNAVEKTAPLVDSSQAPEILAINHTIRTIKNAVASMQDKAIERAGFRIVQAI